MNERVVTCRVPQERWSIQKVRWLAVEFVKRPCKSDTTNHPLLDGNKRAAWVTLRLFIDMNGWSWNLYPSLADAEQAVISVAAGDWNEQRVAE